MAFKVLSFEPLDFAQDDIGAECRILNSIQHPTLNIQNQPNT